MSYYQCCFRLNGTWQKIHDRLRAQVRRKAGRKPTPQRRHPRQPVGKDGRKRGDRCYDAGKKVLGRKRHVIVDTIGLIVASVVHSANIQGREGGKLLHKLGTRFRRLQLIFADGGYAGRFVDWHEAGPDVLLKLPDGRPILSRMLSSPRRAWHGRSGRVS